MKTVRTLLYVFSAFFMLSVVFLFLPWDWLNAFMALFGEYVFPHDSLVQYLVRMMLALTFWFGVLMAAAVYRLGNLDATILAQVPRLSPHQPAMRKRLAEILGADQAAVNLKVTSTDGLGAIGRQEGIGAQAVVLLIPQEGDGLA